MMSRRLFHLEARQRRPGAPRTALGRSHLAFGVLAVLGGSLVAAPQTDRNKAEAELQAIKAQIGRISGQVTRDQIERDRRTRELRAAELSVGSARVGLERVRGEHAERAARRSGLAQDQHRHEADLASARTALAAQLRTAYLIGSEEPLKLLLNQKDPARAGRMFVYYSYFGRARAAQIDGISAELGEIGRLDRALEVEETRLAELEKERHVELSQLEQAREARSRVLVSLQNESRSRVQSLDRLQRQKSGLEKLLHELERVVPSFPANSQDAFARLRGKLVWPVSGRVLSHFGETRAGGIKWDGLRIASERGAPVRAVSDGRVIYADWLAGLGLLAIVDHGSGYLSLYGHNERLFKAAGDRVTAGDAIAAAGDSGGQANPELYFEIRKGGKPIDPRPWFSTPEPHP
jgi:septal ring factor EnvC (AmiA/AmiB activator)